MKRLFQILGHVIFGMFVGWLFISLLMGLEDAWFATISLFR